MNDYKIEFLPSAWREIDEISTSDFTKNDKFVPSLTSQNKILIDQADGQEINGLSVV